MNASTYAPDWTTTAGKLVITPVIYANQTAIALSDSALSITWKRKEGSSTEAALTTNETVSGNILTVSANKLSGVSSGLLTYIAYVTYTDPDTGLPINATADISFAMIRTGENAKSAWVSGPQIFKYDTEGMVSPAQIALTANIQNVVMGKWQYKNANGEWMDYPTTSDNATITSTTLIVKPSHMVWVDESATIRVTTSDDNIGDVTSIYKVSDGATGSSGASGESAPTVFLTNENITFAGKTTGQVLATTKTCNVVAYLGTTKVTPVVGAVTGAPTGMTVTVLEVSNNEIPIQISIASNATLGGSGQQQGTLHVPVTYPVDTTLQIAWSKVNTGANGSNSVVFSLYAPNGTVFVNGAGSLTIRCAAYRGSTSITSGATYSWAQYSAGSWETLEGQASSSLTVSGSSVVGIASFRCSMVYKDQIYRDVIT